jgi:hypothetical protein
VGIFVESRSSAPAIREALADALRANPAQFADLQKEAADRTAQVLDRQTTRIAWTRLSLAVVFALALLGLAVWTAKENLPDISKGLMTSFQSFSGLVVGLLSGEATAATR